MTRCDRSATRRELTSATLAASKPYPLKIEYFEAFDMSTALKEFAKTIAAGLLLCVGVRVRSIAPERPNVHFWLIVLLGVGVSVLLQRWQLAGQPILFAPDGLLADGFGALLMLGVAFFIATRRPQVAYSLASVLLVAQWLIGILWTAGAIQVNFSPKNAVAAYLFSACAAWWLFASYQGLRFANIGTTLVKRLSLSVVLAALTLWPAYSINFPRYVNLDEEKLYAEEAALTEPTVEFDPEAVMYAQRNLVETALSKLQPSRKGTAELFVLAVAGDGGENTFLNEAVYAQALFERRFGAVKHTQILVNHPRTTGHYPLASLTNLRATLKGMAQKMDLDEDILFLFMTSHGSPTHEFALRLPPLPLNQITPATLARALAQAGIERRVILVSACYSGGYLDALSGPQTVVMTSARSDRTSFGCGGDFETTYFGRAYLLEALNQHKDLLKAFQSAEKSVSEREIKEGQLASFPQVRVGEQSLAMLAQWKRSFEVGEPVPFFEAEESRAP